MLHFHYFYAPPEQFYKGQKTKVNPGYFEQILS